MDNLRNQMVALRQGVTSSASERGRVVADIKVQTAHTLRAFDQERMAMARTLKSELTADRLSRSADVLALRDTASKMCMGFYDERVLMRRNLQHSLAQSKEAVVSSVAALCHDFSRERVSSSKAHRHMARAQRSALAKDRRDRTHAVTKLMGAFSKAHRHMAKTQRAGLARGRRERSHAVAGLTHDFDALRQRMAHELAHSLAESRQQTKDQVSGLSWTAVVPRGHESQTPGAEHEHEHEHEHEESTLGEAVRHLVAKTWKSKKK